MPNKLDRFLRSILLAMLTGVFPLIALWKANLGQIPSSVILTPMLFTLLFVLVCYGIWLLISRSFEKAALLSALLNVFVFSFGHVFNFIGQMTILGVSIGFIKLLVVYLIALIILMTLVFRVKHFSNTVFLSANLAFGLLIFINIVPIVSFYFQTQKISTNLTSSAQVATTKADRPDIYYIVLDSYARDDILKNLIGYDNSAFLEALRSRGFYIPNCAFSNYDDTILTIASVFNYQSVYGNTPVVDLGRSKKANLIQENQIAKTFKKYGYRFVTGHGYTGNDISTSDIYLDYRKFQGLPDDLAQLRFTNLYLNTTVMRVLFELANNNPEKFSWIPFWLVVSNDSNTNLNYSSFWFYQNNYMFDSLEKIPEMSGPYLVYAHINSPHVPYVFRADGTFRYPLDTQDTQVLYADTITYLNKRVLELVDILLKKSSVPPIIIIQGDHGIHKMTSGLDIHKILSAYYLPGTVSTPPYDTITPDNDFRLILKDYFDPSVDLIPDTIWLKSGTNYQAVPSSCSLGG
jgi:hypothetical protein